MQLSKNGSRLPQSSANIKGTVSGTLVPTSDQSEVRVLRSTEAACQRFVTSGGVVKIRLSAKSFIETAAPRRASAGFFRKAGPP
jgi:hypothetical protein